MKLHYYEGTDSLYIDLAAAMSADSQEITDGLVIDYDADGRSLELIFSMHPNGWI